MKKLRSALIGLGARTKNYYVPAIKNSQFSQLVAVCDINQQKVNQYQNEFGVRGYQDYQELIESENLDLLIAVTPHSEYKNIVNYAASRKVHILKEKPFAMNFNEAVYLNQICQVNQIQLMTTLQRRLNPIYLKFFDYVKYIGHPYKIDAKYHFFRDDLDQGWRASKKISGGGCILDMGYHIIDIIIWYFGLPEQIIANMAKPQGDYDVEDTADIMFRYANGLNGTITISRSRPPKTEIIEVLGSKGIIHIEPTKIQLFKTNGDLIDCYPKSDILLTNPIDYFCQVVKGEQINIGSPQHHLAHHSFIEACYASQEQGRYVSPQLEVSYV